jgi:hypothetical protein
MTLFASKFKYDKNCASDLRETEIHLTEPGGKINRAFYRDCLLLENCYLISGVYSDYYTFQQDGASAH